MRIRLGYPAADAEIAILESQRYIHPVTQIEQVVPVAELLSAQEALKDVYIDDLVKEYIVEMVEQTRHHADIYLGASPRGSLALYRTGQARAAMHGRDYVLPDDIKKLAVPTLAHRLIVSPAARLKDVTGETVMREILTSLRVPGADVRPH
jgi:MoxR-like ATPase